MLPDISFKSLFTGELHYLTNKLSMGKNDRDRFWPISLVQRYNFNNSLTDVMNNM